MNLGERWAFALLLVILGGVSVVMLNGCGLPEKNRREKRCKAYLNKEKFLPEEKVYYLKNCFDKKGQQ